ncbi:MAG: benenodin family lasso peptide [Sphingomonadales bacterium]|nr:benenodin family lasso peptide [Sphingomonadales bacterium]MDE2169399.1 benenodin family lasso peptide [Sphingomonadales bacterium]
MDHNDTSELIELGAASIETRGPAGGNLDGVNGIQALGLSDAED